MRITNILDNGFYILEPDFGDLPSISLPLSIAGQTLKITSPVNESSTLTTTRPNFPNYIIQAHSVSLLYNGCSAILFASQPLERNPTVCANIMFPIKIDFVRNMITALEQSPMEI